MRSYKTKAIIIKQYEVGEADRIIKAFSRDFGLITLSAKGVRKTLAKLKGHLELYTYSGLQIHQSRGPIDVITDAYTIHSFKKLRHDLKNTSRIFLIFEFLNKVLPEREEHKKIFDLLLFVLRDLEKRQNKKRRLLLSSYFLLRALKELGYAPHFRECIRCQTKLNRGGNYFDFNGAGTICPSCAGREYGMLEKVSDHVLIGLRILNENEDINIAEIKAGIKVFKNLADLIQKYVEFVIESELKSKNFIKEIDK